MLAEFLESLGEIISSAETPKKVDFGDARSVLISTNGKLSEQAIPPPVRNHIVTHLDDFIIAVNRWGAHGLHPDEQETAEDGGAVINGVVYHSTREIVLVVDDDDRRDIVTMPLAESQTFTMLRMVHQKQISHKDFVAMLKSILRGKVIDSLLVTVRKIEIASGSRQSAEVQQGRERGTREFQHELANATELPELIDVTTPVYSNYGLRTALRIPCTLDVELPQLVFRLAPLPDHIDIAVEAAQAEIHERLLSGVCKGIDVFHGSPYPVPIRS